MTVRIAIDLNVRVRGNQTYSGFEDVRIPGGDPAAVLLLKDIRPGTRVLAFEKETGLVTDGEIADVDTERGLVYLAVDWGGFRDDPEAADDPSCE